MCENCESWLFEPHPDKVLRVEFYEKKKSWEETDYLVVVENLCCWCLRNSPYVKERIHEWNTHRGHVTVVDETQ